MINPYQIPMNFPINFPTESLNTIPSQNDTNSYQSIEESEILCKYCKKEYTSRKGNKILKTCNKCLEKKRKYENNRGKTLREERKRIYTERYNVICSTCHSRKAMKKGDKQLHTCKRCSDYKRETYKRS